MGPVVVSVVLVGACIGMLVWWFTGGPAGAASGQGATRVGRSGRGDPTAVAVPWWVRLRSAVMLGCLSAALGLAAAAGVGLVLVALFVLLRSSVG